MNEDPLLHQPRRHDISTFALPSTKALSCFIPDSSPFPLASDPTYPFKLRYRNIILLKALTATFLLLHLLRLIHAVDEKRIPKLNPVVDAALIVKIEDVVANGENEAENPKSAEENGPFRCLDMGLTSRKLNAATLDLLKF
ncbi:unnamed protein product [Vicia faba]|uniref:Uncharacterized protein n=1 Tax=Vicia faba TaxID=3906 RepID=A0AAV1B516_VICFA|nr:unnamed protein product [Vicia faba]